MELIFYILCLVSLPFIIGMFLGMKIQQDAIKRSIERGEIEIILKDN